ncbi:hypothetical protein [Mesorhizobium sp. B2-3-4]|uniref:hypothetical protein n=1 Tax=Mesorhizobium sp. B2-3-4 TaxID=2589959 RepID=UPI00112DB3B5|nr:hypothetical protein [Mesorhizobium sp. B2-3-4]TPM35609.1 hypothetical protein FJ967_19585 [Mesorhizobium sp. B2-3-4]
MVGRRLFATAIALFGLIASAPSADSRNNAASAVREPPSPGAPQSTQAGSTPQRPRTIKFRAIAASGLFAKTLSLRGTLAGETTEREFARVLYPALNQPISSRDWITVENVSAAYLQLDIDPEFAMPGVPLHMRSDDPATSDYLFHKVGDRWIQAPRATRIDVFSYAGCGLTQQSWEDGGDFHHQDFFFEVDTGSDCGVADASWPDRRVYPR